MSTEEGNKLIAEFDGAKINPLNYIRGEFIVAEYPNIHFGLHCHPIQDLKYHTSFDWLMPVVKEIKQLKIEDFPKKKPVMNALYDVDIYLLHKAVVEFIQWYNTQKL